MKKILIHKGDILKYINIDDIELFINEGWEKGISDKHREKMSKIPHTAPGKCLDPIKELLRKEKISNAMKGNTNWMLNKRRGNGKLGWYDNIYFDSTWELAFYIYYKEHNMYIKRNNLSYTYIFENRNHKYTPDFITDEGIIEIKGRKDKKAKAKELQFPLIIIYDKFKIKPILVYIINKYGKDFHNKFYDVLYHKSKVSKKQHEDKFLLKEHRKNIIENLYKNSGIDFTKYGWVGKAKLYLSNRNELWDVNLHKCIRKVYPEFYNLPNIFIRNTKR